MMDDDDDGDDNDDDTWPWEKVIHMPAYLLTLRMFSCTNSTISRSSHPVAAAMSSLRFSNMLRKVGMLVR